MTYGVETWTLTKQAQNKFAGAQTKMEWSMLNITYKDRKTNIWVRERTKVIDITNTEKNEMVLARAYQPPQRRPMDLACHYLETIYFYDKKRQGRPAKRWRGDLDKYWIYTIWQRTAQYRLTACWGIRPTTGQCGCLMMMMMMMTMIQWFESKKRILGCQNINKCPGNVMNWQEKQVIFLTPTSPHHLTTSPPHHLTTSPPHHLTTSPPHHLTTSPPHHLTTSPPHPGLGVLEVNISKVREISRTGEKIGTHV